MMWWSCWILQLPAVCIHLLPTTHSAMSCYLWMSGRGPRLWRHPIPPPLGIYIPFTFLLQELSQRSNSGATVSISTDGFSPLRRHSPAKCQRGWPNTPLTQGSSPGVTLGALYWLFMLATALKDRYAQAVKVIQYFQYRPCPKPVHLQTYRIAPLLNTRGTYFWAAPVQSTLERRTRVQFEKREMAAKIDNFWAHLCRACIYQGLPSTSQPRKAAAATSKAQ